MKHWERSISSISHANRSSEAHLSTSCSVFPRPSIPSSIYSEHKKLSKKQKWPRYTTLCKWPLIRILSGHAVWLLTRLFHRFLYHFCTNNWLAITLICDALCYQRYARLRIDAEYPFIHASMWLCKTFLLHAIPFQADLTKQNGKTEMSLKSRM